MPATESDGSVSVDPVIHAIADEHRRAVLRLLNRADGEAVHLDALADDVAERIDSGDLPAGEHRHRIRIALHQIHLPKLRSYGLVCYDTETKQVRSTTGDLSQELLAVLESYETTE